MRQTLNDQLSAFEDACRKEGLRLTPQRLEIFKELAVATDHPTAEMLHQRLLVKMPTLSLDTVYRTLGTLSHHDLINKVDTVESQARFEVMHFQHHHLICQNCKEIIDFQWKSMDSAALPQEISDWGQVNRKNIVVYGTCNKCLK